MEKSTKKDQKAKLRKNLLTLINEYSLADRLPMDFFDRHPDYLPQILTFSNLGDLSLQMEQYELSGCIWVISHNDYMMKFVSMPQKNLIRHVFIVPGGGPGRPRRLPGNQLWIDPESRVFSVN